MRVLMRSVTCLLAALLVTGFAGPTLDRWAPPNALAAAGFTIYFNDEDETPGSIYAYEPATGQVTTLYTRPSGKIASFVVDYLPHKLYFVSGSTRDIYRVDRINQVWQTPQVIFTHDTYVRDLDFREDSPGQLRLYFSQSSGAGVGCSLRVIATVRQPKAAARRATS